MPHINSSTATKDDSTENPESQEEQYKFLTYLDKYPAKVCSGLTDRKNNIRKTEKLQQS